MVFERTSRWSGVSAADLRRSSEAAEGPAIMVGSCGSSSVGRAAAFQAACRGFEPRLPLHPLRTDRQRRSRPAPRDRRERSCERRPGRRRRRAVRGVSHRRHARPRRCSRGRGLCRGPDAGDVRGCGSGDGCRCRAVARVLAGQPPRPGRRAWSDLLGGPCGLATIERVVAVEGRQSTIELGRRLAADRGWTWQLGDAAASRPDAADVVAAGYLLGELDPEAQERLLDRAWAATHGVSSSSSRAVAPGSSGSSRPGTGSSRRAPGSSRRARRGRLSRRRVADDVVPLPRPARPQPAPPGDEAGGPILGGRAVLVCRRRAPLDRRRSAAARRARPPASPAGRRGAPRLRRRPDRDRRPQPSRRSGLPGCPRPRVGGRGGLRRPRSGLSRRSGGRSGPTFRGLSATPDTLRPIPCPV